MSYYYFQSVDGRAEINFNARSLPAAWKILERLVKDVNNWVYDHKSPA